MTEAQKENLRRAREAAAAKRAAAKAEADAALLQAPAAVFDEEITVDESEEEVRIERRRRLLGDNQEAWALVSDDELEKIEREEALAAKEKQRKQVMADARAAARHHAAVEYDLISADTLRSDAERARLAEPRTFTINLPGDGAGHNGRHGIRVDGFLYEAGRTYTRSTAVFETLREIFYRVHLNEVTFRTLDQHKPGNSAVEVLSRSMPTFEVRHAG